MAWFGARVLLYPYSKPTSWGTITAVDISSRVKRFGTRRGRSFVLDDFDAGSASLELDNSDGQLTAGNTGIVNNLLDPDIALPGRLSQSGARFVSSGVTTAPDVSWAVTSTYYTNPAVKAAVQASAAAGAAIKVGDAVDFVPVTASTTYSARARAFYEGTPGGTVNARVNVTWYNASMTVVSTTNGTTAALGSGQANAVDLSASSVTSPAGAAWAQVWVEVTSGALPNAYTLAVSRFSFVAGGATGHDYGHDLWPFFDVNSVVALEVGLSGGGWQRVFTGAIDSIRTSNDEGSPALATATVELSDFARTLGGIVVDEPTGKVIDGTVPLGQPCTVVGYMPLNDTQPAGSLTSDTPITGGVVRDEGVKGTIVFGEVDGPGEYEGSAVQLRPFSSSKGKSVAFPLQAAGTSETPGIIAGWVRMSRGLPSTGLYWGIMTLARGVTYGAGPHLWTLRISDSGKLQESDLLSFTGERSFTDEEWHHVAVAFDPAIDGGMPRVYFDNTLLGWAVTPSAWVDWGSSTGYLNGWSIQLGRGTGSDSAGAADTSYFSGDLAQWCFVTPFSGGGSLTEEQELLAALYHSGANRLGEGQTELERFQMLQTLAGEATTTPSGFESFITLSGVEGGTSLNEAALDIGRSSGAFVFVDVDGNLTMTDRVDRQLEANGTAYAVTESGLLPTDSLEYERTYERLATTAVVTSDGVGLRATVTDAAAEAVRDKVVDELATKSLSYDDMLMTASWRLALRKRMGWRVGTVTFDCTSNSSSSLATLMSWELGSADRLDFSAMLPSQAPQEQSVFFVESIEIEVDVDDSRITWTADLSDASLYLQVAHDGVLGGASVLGW